MSTLFFILQFLSVTQASTPCAVHEAILQNQLQNLEQFIEEGCDLNTQDSAGTTPLMLAIQKKNTPATDLLLAHANLLDLEKRDRHGITALNWAAMGNQADALKRLIDLQADINTFDQDGDTPAFFSVMYKNHQSLEVLIHAHANLDQPGMLGHTPLTYAIAMGSRDDLFQMLIDGGASLSAKNSDGQTPLIAAVDHYQSDLVQRLIAKKADLNDQDPQGETPMMKAIYNSDLKMIDVLLTAGADLEMKKNTGETALIYATNIGEPEIALKLISGGANVNAEDSRGNSALIYSIKDEEIKTVQSLIVHGAILEHKNKNGDNALITAGEFADDEILSYLISIGARLNERNHQGKSALMKAEKAPCESCVQILLQAGALPYQNEINQFVLDIDMSIPDRMSLFTGYLSPKKENHLIMAMKNHYFIPASKMIDFPGMNLNQQDDEGNTALMLMVKSRLPNLVEGMLLQNADRTLKDKNGMTALGYAEQLGYAEIVKLLRL